MVNLTEELDSLESTGTHIDGAAHLGSPSNSLEIHRAPEIRPNLFGTKWRVSTTRPSSSYKMFSLIQSWIKAIARS